MVVNSVDECGYPNAKQMYKMKYDGLKTFWFSTNTSSMRVQHFIINPKASLYFHGSVSGLMLVGTMEICTDLQSRELLWNDSSEVYYPLGINDPDYCVLKFTAQTGNLYYDMSKHLFDIE
ncbi:MAG: pyridoxamine 5'-phosphate oxidase family protein [Gorillibacterium sp.]|nr:pyridoxamine 5'-phosphate oxidase family protein [Gorillibacterium sp.]